MSNIFEGHLLPRLKQGDTEHIRLELYNEDGSPFELPDIPDPTPGPWNVVADADMQHGWTSLGANYSVRYRKHADGMVEMRGYAKPGTKDVMFYLPVGFRPVNMDFMSLVFPILGYDSGTSSYKQCVVAIGADGAVYASDFPDVFYMHMSPIKFYAN